MNKCYSGWGRLPCGPVRVEWDGEGVRQVGFTVDAIPVSSLPDNSDNEVLDQEAQHLLDELLVEPPVGLDGFSIDGTPFQRSVWQAVLSIPFATVTTYQKLADSIGRPEAVRAVANAVGANPIAYFIPCHRVVRSDGGLGGYRWGVERKRAILDWERDRVSRAA